MAILEALVKVCIKLVNELKNPRRFVSKYIEIFVLLLTLCSCASRQDLLEACESRNLDLLQKEFPL